MKYKILTLWLLLTYVKAMPQDSTGTAPDSIFSTYYFQRVTHFLTLPSKPKSIVFLGDSITDGAEWDELFPGANILNRGISGDITAGVLKRLHEVSARKPGKVFLHIGVNDLSKGVSVDSIYKNIIAIVRSLKRNTPATKVYVQSILPVNDAFNKFSGHTNKGAAIVMLNTALKRSAEGEKYVFLNLHSSFCDQNGKLAARFTNDGLHLKGEGYLLWKHLLYPYVYDLQEKASLLPAPQSVVWKYGVFPLYRCRKIVCTDESFKQQAILLSDDLKSANISCDIVTKNNEDSLCIVIKKKETGGKGPLEDEAYALDVTENKITIQASTAHGVFNAIQTLRQLMRESNFVDACSITDKPAFAWRGLMTDVGRNYQSLDQLKEQIEIMSRYKLNVFHLHLTEDIAWRLQIKQYPQLTAPENMERDKGMFYSEADIKELIAYCKNRFILFVPEVDVPGHSAAFKRALKIDMQSDSGLVVVKNIFKEISATYDIPYIHIGGDEVKIVNANFLPAIVKELEQMNKHVVGWSPGGNIPPSVIHQLWQELPGKLQSEQTNTEYLDSRHLYINHFDPLEAVVTIFRRKLGGGLADHLQLKGAVLCCWHDRRVNKEDDILRMNAVYLSLLAFAERSWLGGGEERPTTSIGAKGSKEANEFAEFENRLLDQKEEVFSDLGFPYQQQATYNWKLFGPFDNRGNLDSVFDPEKDTSLHSKKATVETEGGTIIFRHWWAPVVNALLQNPQENSTWYATTEIWSDEDCVGKFWIGFNNTSRSMATRTPPINEWDERKSCVWVNGLLIQPPLWKNGGQLIGLETPLTNEGYESRAPTAIPLRKGWNKVLVKCPVGSFRGTDWQNPVKWMFTFVEVK